MNNKIFIVFFLLLLTASKILFAQPFGDAAKGQRILRMRYTNSSGEKGNTFFFYNDNGMMYKSLWLLDDKSKSSENFYEYDNKGNLVSAFRKFANNLISNEIFIYDNNGDKVSEMFFRSDSIKGDASYIIKDKLVIKAKLNKYKGWLSGEMFFYYDKNFKKEKAELKDGEKLLANVLYEYDSTRNLVKETWDFKGQWTQTFEYFYQDLSCPSISYTSPFINSKCCAKIVSENYTFNGKNGGPTSYHYNDKGLLVEKEFIRSDGYCTKTTIQHDNNQRIISSSRKVKDGTEINFVYKYNSQGNLIQRIYYQNETIVGFESYLYNSQYQIVKAYYRNVDGWLTGEITFTHNLFDQIEKGVYKGENGVTADLTFLYNPNQSLKQIGWQFSTGEFQEYNFVYEPNGR